MKNLDLEDLELCSKQCGEVKNVAVKKLMNGAEDVLTGDLLKEFKQEVRMMTKLSSSQRLVRLIGVCLPPDPVCLVMELMNRGNLFNLLHSEENLTWMTRLQIGIDVGRALEFLHSEKVIHRDVKSSNVMLDGQLRAKFGDFGISQVIHTITAAATKGKTFEGTPQWSAPETFGLRPKFSFSTDVFSMGVVMWELRTRQIPYKGIDLTHSKPLQQ